jgi:hypothetical protein
MYIYILYIYRTSDVLWTPGQLVRIEQLWFPNMAFFCFFIWHAPKLSFTNEFRRPDIRPLKSGLLKS